MDVIEAINLVRRLQNLPEIYDNIEKSVIHIIHSYFQEIFEKEKFEAAVMSTDNYNRKLLDDSLNKKLIIHNKYWSNKANFYQPCSWSSEPKHVWESLFNIEILQNGDDDNSLFLFTAKFRDPVHGLVTKTTYLLKLINNELKIEHEFFG